MSGGPFHPLPGGGGTENDDWYVCCSDEEKYTSTGCPKGKLEWYPDDMVQLLETMEAAAQSPNTDPMKPVIAPGLLENLDWKCPGRRPPTPTDLSEEEDSGDEKQGGVMGAGGDGGRIPANRAAAAASMDFEFNTSDEIVPSGTPLAKLNNDNKELRGSARKKTSDLNSILSNMQRHRRIDQMATSSPAAKPQMANRGPPST